jgi:hypothetical protein
MFHVSYATVIGSLMYAMLCTRPDIAHVVVVLSRYMTKLGKEHWTIVKRGFIYFHGTTSYGLCTHNNHNNKNFSKENFIHLSVQIPLHPLLVTHPRVYIIFSRKFPFLPFLPL